MIWASLSPCNGPATSRYVRPGAALSRKVLRHGFRAFLRPTEATGALGGPKSRFGGVGGWRPKAKGVPRDAAASRLHAGWCGFTHKHVLGLKPHQAGPNGCFGGGVNSEIPLFTPRGGRRIVFSEAQARSKHSLGPTMRGFRAKGVGLWKPHPAGPNGCDGALRRCENLGFRRKRGPESEFRPP